jgi:nitrite reductase (NADH) small subunit
VSSDAWTAVCHLDNLIPGRGVAALVGETQVAVFRVPTGGSDSLFAVEHRDPRSGANVIARGLLGELDGRWYVASPMHKDRFDLATGACLDRPGISLATYRVQVRDSQVLVANMGAISSS